MSKPVKVTKIMRDTNGDTIFFTACGKVYGMDVPYDDPLVASTVEFIEQGYALVPEPAYRAAQVALEGTVMWEAK